MNDFRIKCFLSVCKNMSISRGAEEMFISQPAMSKQIQELEKEMGVKLINHNGRKIELSDAGVYVFHEFNYLLDVVSSIKRQSKLLESISESKLRIGFEGQNNWANVNSLIRLFSNEHSGVSVEVHVDHWSVLRKKLLSSDLDLVFIAKEEIHSDNSLNYIDLFRNYCCMCMSPKHRLANKKILTIADIRDEHINMINNLKSPISMSAIHERMLKSGMKRENINFVENTDTAIAMALSCCSITSLPRTFKEDGRNDRVYIDFDSKELYIDYVLAWKSSDTNPNIPLFIHQAKEFEFKID